jgi:four helix bundle protein
LIEKHDRDLAQQLRNAATSVVLNIAEVAPGKAWEEEA